MPRISVPVTDTQYEEVRLLAFQKRTTRAKFSSEAIERHIESNRELLKSGKRLPKGKNAK